MSRSISPYLHQHICFCMTSVLEGPEYSAYINQCSRIRGHLHGIFAYVHGIHRNTVKKGTLYTCSIRTDGHHRGQDQRQHTTRSGRCKGALKGARPAAALISQGMRTRHSNPNGKFPIGSFTVPHGRTVLPWTVFHTAAQK